MQIHEAVVEHDDARPLGDPRRALTRAVTAFKSAFAIANKLCDAVRRVVEDVALLALTARRPYQVDDFIEARMRGSYRIRLLNHVEQAPPALPRQNRTHLLEAALEVDAPPIAFGRGIGWAPYDWRGRTLAVDVVVVGVVLVVGEGAVISKCDGSVHDVKVN